VLVIAAENPDLDGHRLVAGCWLVLAIASDQLPATSN
jgi:hypothetical protein